MYLGDQATNHKQDNDLSITIQARVKLESNQILQDIREENLDNDPSLEQIIIFKQKDDSEDLLHIMVVDYDEVRGTWSNTWQGFTRSSNIKSFNIRVLNLNGEGLPEIICQGTNDKGEQTLDIFHVLDRGIFPITYSSVLSTTADISIEVIGTDAAASGALAPNTASKGVVSRNKDLESSSPLDMVMTQYQWKPSNLPDKPGQYLVAGSTKIPGATVQEAALDQLFKSDIPELEKKYLDGSWQRSFINQRKKNITQILTFDTTTHTIQFIEGDRMESHEWLSTHKPSYGSSIQVYLVNETFHSLKNVGNIQVLGLNSLAFSLQDRDDWKGEFTRLSAEMEERQYTSNNQSIPINAIVLTGLFRNDSGIELLFAAPHFSWRSGTETRQGGFATFQLNNTVLELEFTDAKGLIEEKRLYIAKLDEFEQGKQQTRKVLELQAAKVSVDGVRRLGEEPIRLEQAALDISR